MTRHAKHVSMPDQDLAPHAITAHICYTILVLAIVDLTFTQTPPTTPVKIVTMAV